MGIGRVGRERRAARGGVGARTAPPAARTSVSLGVPFASPRTTRQKRCEKSVRRYVSRGSTSSVCSISCRPHEAGGELRGVPSASLAGREGRERRTLGGRECDGVRCAACGALESQS